MFLFDSLNDMFHIKKTFDTGLDARGSNSNIFKNQSHHQKTLDAAASGGVLEKLVFYILSVILTTTWTMVSGP